MKYYRDILDKDPSLIYRSPTPGVFEAKQASGKWAPFEPSQSFLLHIEEVPEPAEND